MQSLKLLLDSTLMPHHTPLIQLTDETRLELIEPGQKPPELTALYSGEADLALTNPLVFIRDFLQGKPVVGLASYLTTGGGIAYNPEQLADPAGINPTTRICRLNSSAETTRLMLQALRPGESAKTIQPDLEEFTADPAAAIEGLNNNRYALIFFGSIIPLGILAQTENSPVDFWFSQDCGFPELGELILVSHRSLPEKAPNLLKTTIELLQQKTSELRNAPQRFSSIYSRFSGRDRETLPEILYNSSLNSLKTEFSQNIKLYSKWAAYIARASQLDDYLSFDRLIDERFLPLDFSDLDLNF